MRRLRVRKSILVMLLAFLALSTGTAAAEDQKLFSLVPPGAPIVAEVTYGTEPTFLVLTRNNTADLMDLQSILGVDPTHTIARTIFVAARDVQGHVSEHSLLASGHFDTHHIFKAGIENGAILNEYLGIPVLVLRAPDRDKGISRDLLWLAFIDSQIAILGTAAMVQEELRRYLAHSPADLSLILKLSHLHSADQSWCVLAPTAYNREIVLRTVAALDPIGRQADPGDYGLIMGTHFGRLVEIEYEIVPDFGNKGESQAQAEFSQAATPSDLPTISYFFSNNETITHKVIRVSKKRYHEFIAQEEMRELAHVETGSTHSRKK